MISIILEMSMYRGAFKKVIRYPNSLATLMKRNKPTSKGVLAPQPTSDDYHNIQGKYVEHNTPDPMLGAKPRKLIV